MTEPGNSGPTGPLFGLTVLEMAGLGPVPMAALMLAEMGARVIRVESMHGNQKLFSLPPELDLDRHGREIVQIDLKDPSGSKLVQDLISGMDILVEGYRPGVMERLNLGPDELCGRNPRLIYGRMTGFGQDGNLASRAGHDLTYLAYTGVLNAIGHTESRPTPPLNLVGDYGGGAMFLLVGILAALHERTRSGRGQVVDAAMVDGASMLAVNLFSYMSAGIWHAQRGENLLDSGCPFYDTYETSDAGYVAVACLEPQFFVEFSRLLPLDLRFAETQYDRSCWLEMRHEIASQIRKQTRAHWEGVFEGSDACVAPVLSFEETAAYPHNVSRELHIQCGGFIRPAPAPRFSRTTTRATGEAKARNSRQTLIELGIPRDRIGMLMSSGIVR